MADRAGEAISADQHIAEARRLLDVSDKAKFGAQHDSMVLRGILHGLLALVIIEDAR